LREAYSPPSVLRAQLKAIARKALARVLLLAVRASAGKRGVALLYHEVVRAGGEAERSLGTPVEVTLLDRHVNFLERHFDVVLAGDLAAAVAARRRLGRIPVAITFDDDLESHAILAAPLLRRHGVAGTFFLCGASVHEPRTFWWEYLVAAVRGGWPVADAVGERFAAHLREHDAHGDVGRAASVLQRLDRSARIELDSRLAGLGVQPPGRPLGVEGIAAIAASGSKIGFHTREHFALPALSDEDLVVALEDGRSALEQIAGAPLRSFAYPYGAVDERVVNAVRDAGYDTAFAVGDSAVIGTADRMRVPRIEPRAEPDGRFELRIARALAGRPYR
jgi:peptidoglycan/xylan/chitin deacetylase (PgdA/CDA1 family)